MILNLERKKIPITLINGRITKKSFSKWKIFPYFSKQIFQIFSLCFSSSLESKKYLRKLGAKNVLLKGGHMNSKVMQDILINKKGLKIFKNKK